MLILLLSASTLATASPPPPACTAATTTVEVDTCLSRQADAADGELRRYEAAARAQLAKLASGDPPGGDIHRGGMLQAFDRGESLWREGRDATCRAAFDSYVGGTIAPSIDLDCRIRRTRLQTHAVWFDFLVTGGGTPPVLPEPPVGPGG